MALNSIVIKTGDGVTRDFTFSFTGGYMSQADVFVRVNNEKDGAGNPIHRSITFPNAGTVRVGGTIPAIGEEVKIYRKTPIDNAVNDFSDGTVLDATALDRGFEQLVKAAQELHDGFGSANSASSAAVGAEAAKNTAVEEAAKSQASAAASQQSSNVATQAAATATAQATQAATERTAAETAATEAKNAAKDVMVTAAYPSIADMQAATPRAGIESIVADGVVLQKDTASSNNFYALHTADGRKWIKDGVADFRLAGTTSELSSDFEGRFKQFVDDCTKRGVAMHMSAKRDGTPYDGYRYIDHTLTKSLSIVWDKDAVLKPSKNFQHFATGGGTGPFTITDFTYNPASENALSGMLVRADGKPFKLVSGTDFTVSSTGNVHTVTLNATSVVTSNNAAGATFAVSMGYDALRFRATPGAGVDLRVIGDFSADISDYGFIQASASGSALSVKGIDRWLIDNMWIDSGKDTGPDASILARRGDSGFVPMNQQFGRFGTLNVIGVNDLALYATGDGNASSSSDDGYALLCGVINAQYCNTGAKIVRGLSNARIDLINAYRCNTGYIQGVTGGMATGGGISIGQIKAKFLTRRGFDIRDDLVGGMHLGSLQIEDIGFSQDGNTITTDAAAIQLSSVRGATVDHVSVVQREWGTPTGVPVARAAGDGNYGNAILSGYAKGLTHGVIESGSAAGDVANSYALRLVDCANPYDGTGATNSEFDFTLINTTGTPVSASKLRSDIGTAKTGAPTVELSGAAGTPTVAYTGTNSVRYRIIDKVVYFTVSTQFKITHTETGKQLRINLPADILPNASGDQTPVTIGRIQGLNVPAGWGQLFAEMPADKSYIRLGIRAEDTTTATTWVTSDHVTSAETVRMEFSGTIQL